MSEHVLLEMPTDLSQKHLDHETASAYPKYNSVIALKVDVESTGTPSSSQSVSSASPSRWKTPEFYFYYVVFAIVVPSMVWKPITLSQRTFPTHICALASL